MLSKLNGYQGKNCIEYSFYFLSVDYHFSCNTLELLKYLINFLTFALSTCLGCFKNRSYRNSVDSTATPGVKSPNRSPGSREMVLPLLQRAQRESTARSHGGEMASSSISPKGPINQLEFQDSRTT